MCFYEKFWVTGNTITVLKWNISFADQEEIQILMISCLLTETKLRYPHRRQFEHNLIVQAPIGRDKEARKQTHFGSTDVVGTRTRQRLHKKLHGTALGLI
jgi:hypothetical protein